MTTTIRKKPCPEDVALDGSRGELRQTAFRSLQLRSSKLGTEVGFPQTTFLCHTTHGGPASLAFSNRPAGPANTGDIR